MWWQFYLVNISFAVHILAAIVLLATAWLYWDAHKAQKKSLLPIIALGFALLGVSFLAASTQIDASILPTFFISLEWLPGTILLFKAAGYSVLILGQLSTPLAGHPSEKPKKIEGASAGVFFGLGAFDWGLFSLPVLCCLAAFLYLRRATIGLENHLKTVSLALFIFSLAEILNLMPLFSKSSDIFWINLTRPFGPIWIGELVLLGLAGLILGKWVFSYLLKQFFAQIFVYGTLGVTLAFLLTTIAFTSLLVNSIKNEALKQLTSDNKVVLSLISSKQAELLSDIQLLANNSEVAQALEATSKNVLGPAASDFLVIKKQSSLIILDKNGRLVARGEDQEKIGGVVSDSLVRRALAGISGTSMGVNEGVISPQVVIRAAAPIFLEKKIVGAILAENAIDDSFIDGLKLTTGLDASIYGESILAATTLVGFDGKTRLVGIKEKNSKIVKEVLVEGKDFAGETVLGQRNFLGAWSAIKDIDNNSLGMVFVGRPQVGILKTAGESLEITFLVTLGLITLSLIPTYLFARQLSYQVR